MFVSYQNFLRTLELHYKIFDNSHLKFGKRGQAKQKIACSTARFDFCGLSKMCGFATFPEIQLRLCHFECQKGDQNSTAFKKQTRCFSIFYLNVTCRPFENDLVKFVALVALKILDNLASMQNSLNANNCGHKQNLDNCST